jgi:hypothetical protein
MKNIYMVLVGVALTIGLERCPAKADTYESNIYLEMQRQTVLMRQLVHAVERLKP